MNTSLSTQHDEIVITPILGSSYPPLPAHSHFGGKQPKQHKPPKCISVLCKEEKEKLNTRLQDVNERELEGIKEQLNCQGHGNDFHWSDTDHPGLMFHKTMSE